MSAAALLFLAGCRTSLEPKLSPAPAPPPVLVIAPDGTVSYTVPQPYMSDGGTPAGNAALSVSKKVTGQDGGWLRCGRLYLVVSKGAFDSVATITMSMKDSTVMVVDLQIDPPTANGFKAPVYLSLTTTGVTVSPDSLSLYWLGAKAATWSTMSCSTNMTSVSDCATQVSSPYDAETYNSSQTTDGIWTSLPHFSQYSAGKAGW